MNVFSLIGKAACHYLAERVQPEDNTDGTSRFLLDRLTGQQVAAICEEIQSNTQLASVTRVRIPRELGAPYGVPDSLLTDERTTHWRHADCDRPVLLIANTDDDQGQSLQDVSPIGSGELLAEPRLWVTEAARGLDLTDQRLVTWEKALKGLQDARSIPLELFASYVLKVADAIRDDGLPLVAALGSALPALRVPKDSAFFEQIPQKLLNHAERWKRIYKNGFEKRATYLSKFTPTQQPITQGQLSDNWTQVAEHVDPSLHPVFRSFIDTPGKWTQEAKALCELEWESDNVSVLFSGLKTSQVALGQQTADFYEDEFPGTLSASEEEHLKRLDKRRSRDSNDEDTEFYELHRSELANSRSLKAKWDRFIYGKPIETEDFADGLLRCLERLFEQAGPAAESRTLTIESSRRTPKAWLELNTRAAMFFSRRYRGMKNLTSKVIEWQVGDIFTLERTIEKRKSRDRFSPTRSVSKANTQIKFFVTLECTTGNVPIPYTVQMIWRFNPTGIYAEFNDDWDRLTKHPLMISSVTREPVSKKGKLQTINLADVSTLMPVYRQARGSLISAYDRDKDLAQQIPLALDQAAEKQRLTAEGHSLLMDAWKNFSECYTAAVNEFYVAGTSSSDCLKIEHSYIQLLESLIQHAPGDRNRKEIWEPILGVGLTTVDGGPTATIVAPWHPLRLLGMAARARQVCGLIRHLVGSATVDFGDPRLFFQDLAEELRHPYYPEVCVGLVGSQPTLLAHSDIFSDYTLMELPVANYEDDATNENPKKTSRQIVDLVRKYIDLLPHETANLSVVLFNCNSARLPEATVEALGDLYDDSTELRCQVVVRHDTLERLNELYEKILDGSDGDADSSVASEASHDFMARLRVGIMADSAPIPHPEEGPPVDIVFLQDVIARLSEQVWLEELTDAQEPDVLNHTPSRNSRRPPGTRDDLKSVLYLVCPIQPRVGWRYLQCLQGVVEGLEPDLHSRPAPARQISFQHNATRRIFDEAHRLGQWVVNSDDLLTRRQLRNQDVKVIKYQQQRYGGRSLVISSKAPLNLLEVMVQRRLQKLSLGLDASDLKTLTSRVINDAGEISGDIVLRAAKRGEFANELLGLALSRFLLQDELGKSKYVGWYLLDDYAAWLGQKEQHIADIMALNPERVEESTVLKVFISEAKYVNRGGLADSRRSSLIQLRETVTRMQEALFGSPSRLDRDLWLSRLADVLLDGIDVPATEGQSLYEWRDAVRTGSAKLLIKGYSHVFVHSEEVGGSDPSERIEISQIEHGWQEVYGREQVRQLFLAYHENRNPRDVRSTLGDDLPWGEGVPLVPSKRVMWAAEPRPRKARLGTSANAEDTQLPTESPDPSAEPIQIEPTEAESPMSAALSTDATADQSGMAVSDLAPIDFSWAAPNQRQVLSSLASSAAASSRDDEWLLDAAGSLRSALHTYNLQAKLLDQRLTPNSALIRFQGSDRLRSKDILQRRTELLSTHGLEITNVSAEPGQIVVCVARPNRQIVSLIDVWRKRAVDSSELRSNQSLILGVRESDGETLYLAPGEEHAPHTLIAGTTGSGKSVLIQNLLLDIASTNACSQAKIVLIDPKQGADYLDLHHLPHLQDGIIVSQDAARVALENAVVEMKRRYQLFRSAGVANLKRFNAQTPPDERQPVIWIFHDEFAVWMLDEAYKATVSSTVQQLGVMARAAGIFLIFAAQRPEDRVMPLQLRDNLGNRLILRVESPGTSKIALGEEGAERLLGKGHLAARLQNSDRVILAQVPIISPENMRLVVNSILEDGRSADGVHVS